MKKTRLNYHIGGRLAICLGTVKTGRLQGEDVVDQINQFFEGKYDGTEKDIKAQMEECSANQNSRKRVP